jgi:branched-subunit amino acid ABC-type transport system permease component
MDIAVGLILYLLLVVSFALWMWAKRRLIAGSILLGVPLGGVIGFWVGVALGPGPEAGAMYGLEQFASGVVGGAIGILIGPILGGIAGWAVWEWREEHRLARRDVPRDAAQT